MIERKPYTLHINPEILKLFRIYVIEKFGSTYGYMTKAIEEALIGQIVRWAIELYGDSWLKLQKEKKIPEDVWKELGFTKVGDIYIPLPTKIRPTSKESLEKMLRRYLT